MELIERFLKATSSCIQSNPNAIEELVKVNSPREPLATHQQDYRRIYSEWDRILQNQRARSIPPMVVKDNGMLYTFNWGLYSEEEANLLHSLTYLSSKEKQMVEKVMERDRKFQTQMSNSVPQISFKSPPPPNTLTERIYNIGK